MAYKLPKDYFTIDFETNGLPKNDSFKDVAFTEVGYATIIDCQFSKDRVVQALAKPIDENGVQIPLTQKIVDLTGITDEMLKDKESSIIVAEKTFGTFVNSDLAIVGYNIINFDKGIIDKYTDLLGWKRIKDSRYIDAAALFKTYRKAHRQKTTAWELPASQNNFYVWCKAMLEKSWQEDQIKYNLDAALGYLGIPQFGIEYERHRAIYDAILTHKALEELRVEMSL